MMDTFFKKMNFRKLPRAQRQEAVLRLSRELHFNGITAVPVQRWPNVALAHDDSKPTQEEIIINRLGFIFLVSISIDNIKNSNTVIIFILCLIILVLLFVLILVLL